VISFDHRFLNNSNPDVAMTWNVHPDAAVPVEKSEGSNIPMASTSTYKSIFPGFIPTAKLLGTERNVIFAVPDFLGEHTGIVARRTIGFAAF
jgi:hypothetical protein